MFNKCHFSLVIIDFFLSCREHRLHLKRPLSSLESNSENDNKQGGFSLSLSCLDTINGDPIPRPKYGRGEQQSLLMSKACSNLNKMRSDLRSVPRQPSMTCQESRMKTNDLELSFNNLENKPWSVPELVHHAIHPSPSFHNGKQKARLLFPFKNLNPQGNRPVLTDLEIYSSSSHTCWKKAHCDR